MNMNYTYSKLGDLKAPGIFHVYGVVSEILKLNATMANGKKHTMISMIDETLPKDAPFRLHFFLGPQCSLKLEPRSILRLHRMKVEPWDKAWDGRIFRLSDVVIFPGAPNSDFTYTTEAKITSITAKDKARVEELRELAVLDGLSLELNEEFNVLVTASQRVTLPYSDEGTSGSADKGNQNVEDACSKVAKDKAPVEELRKTAVFNGPSHELSEEFQAVVTDTLRVTFPYSDEETSGSADEGNQNMEDACTKLNPVNGNNADGESQNVIAAPYQVVYLNPFNKRSKRYFVQGGLKDESRKSLDVAKPSSASGVSKMYSKLCGPSAPDRGGVSGYEDNSKRGVTPSDQYEVLDPKSDFDANEDEASQAASCDQFSMLVQEGLYVNTPMSPSCPGVACAGKMCAQGPILLDDDDPRLIGFNEDDLITEGEGDIPAAGEDGTLICLPKGQYMPYKCGEVIQTTFEELNSFRWPEVRSKVKIVNIKPTLKSLVKAPKNLLSGTCVTCTRYSFYSSLKWKMDQGSKTKKPMCPICLKDGHERSVLLEYRVKLTIRDAWGSDLDVYVIEKNASTFFGCSSLAYLGRADIRAEVLETLAKVIPSKDFIYIRFYRALTPIGPIFYVCNTELKDIVNQLSLINI